MLNEHCSSNDDLMIIARISTKPFPSLSHQLFSPHPSLTYSSVSTQGQTSRRMRCCDQINFSLQKDQIIPPSPILDRCFFISSVTILLTSFHLFWSILFLQRTPFGQLQLWWEHPAAKLSIQGFLFDRPTICRLTFVRVHSFILSNISFIIDWSQIEIFQENLLPCLLCNEFFFIVESFKYIVKNYISQKTAASNTFYIIIKWKGLNYSQRPVPVLFGVLRRSYQKTCSGLSRLSCTRLPPSSC